MVNEEQTVPVVSFYLYYLIFIKNVFIQVFILELCIRYQYTSIFFINNISNWLFWNFKETLPLRNINLMETIRSYPEMEGTGTISILKSTKFICTVHLTLCSYHVMYVFQSEFTLYDCLNLHSTVVSSLWNVYEFDSCCRVNSVN